VDHEAVLSDLRAEIAQNGDQYTVAYSPVCDIPIDELCTLKFDCAAGSNIMFEDDLWGEKEGPDQDGLVGVQALSSTLDYTGCCGVVRNLAPPGCIWDYVSIDAIESAYACQGGLNLNLSEKWLLDCNTAGYTCSGGWFYFPVSGGIPLESGYYSFNGIRETCRPAWGPLYDISAAYCVSGYPNPPVTNIKNAIQNYGGVAAAVYVNSAFQYYSSGCFTGCSNRTVNHMILLCGWDDDRCGTIDCWRLKNSWGTGWGESGFMWIKYGCSRVGYAACYVVI
jgi:hypothetical protein